MPAITASKSDSSEGVDPDDVDEYNSKRYNEHVHSQNSDGSFSCGTDGWKCGLIKKNADRTVTVPCIHCGTKATVQPPRGPNERAELFCKRCDIRFGYIDTQKSEPEAPLKEKPNKIEKLSAEIHAVIDSPDDNTPKYRELLIEKYVELQKSMRITVPGLEFVRNYRFFSWLLLKEWGESFMEFLADCGLVPLDVSRNIDFDDAIEVKRMLQQLFDSGSLDQVLPTYLAKTDEKSFAAMTVFMYFCRFNLGLVKILAKREELWLFISRMFLSIPTEHESELCIFLRSVAVFIPFIPQSHSVVLCEKQDFIAKLIFIMETEVYWGSSWGVIKNLIMSRHACQALIHHSAGSNECLPLKAIFLCHKLLPGLEKSLTLRAAHCESCFYADPKKFHSEQLGQLNVVISRVARIEERLFGKDYRPHKKIMDFRQTADELTDEFKHTPRLVHCSSPKCSKMETKEVQFHECSACKQVAYCSRECQASHWKGGHRSFCRTFCDAKA